MSFYGLKDGDTIEIPHDIKLREQEGPDIMRLKIRSLDHISPVGNHANFSDYFNFEIDINKNSTGKELKDEIEAIVGVRPDAEITNCGQGYMGGSGGRLKTIVADVKDDMKIGDDPLISKPKSVSWALKLFKEFKDLNVERAKAKMKDMRDKGASIGEDTENRLISSINNRKIDSNLSSTNTSMGSEDFEKNI